MQILKTETPYNPETEISYWPAENGQQIVHILHGMGEHKNRYDDFANFLNQNNIHVYAHDHPGHGSHLQTFGKEGHFGDQNGFDNVLSTVKTVQDTIHDQHPELPIIILGHSMGSFIAQHYLMSYKPDNVSAMILSGSAHTPRFLIHALKWVAQLESLRLGNSAYSALIDTLSFSSYSKAFKPQRTQFDWLSRDPNAVDKYIKDELCGFILGAQSWKELAQALLYIGSTENLRKVPANLPVLIISGDKDPVGGFGKYVQALDKTWKQSGHTNVELQLLQDARHEVLNESNKENTYNALLQWMHKAVS